MASHESMCHTVCIDKGSRDDASGVDDTGKRGYRAGRIDVGKGVIPIAQKAMKYGVHVKVESRNRVRWIVADGSSPKWRRGAWCIERSDRAVVCA